MPEKRQRRSKANLEVLLSSSDVCALIFSLLPASSILCLWRTTQGLHATIGQYRRKKLFTRRVQAALNTFFCQNAASGHTNHTNLTEPVFSAALRAGKAVLSGSFVLAVLENETYWKDLDVYRLLADKWLDEVENVMWRAIGENEAKFSYDNYDNLPIRIVRNYQLPATVQVMACYDDPVTTICREFDLGFLKNAYDGSGVTIFDATAFALREAPYIATADKARCGTALRAIRAERAEVARLLKYRGRGLRILGHANQDFSLVTLSGSTLRMRAVSLFGRAFATLIHQDDLELLQYNWMCKLAVKDRHEDGFIPLHSLLVAVWSEHCGGAGAHFDEKVAAQWDAEFSRCLPSTYRPPRPMRDLDNVRQE